MRDGNINARDCIDACHLTWAFVTAFHMTFDTTSGRKYSSIAPPLPPLQISSAKNLVGQRFFAGSCLHFSRLFSTEQWTDDDPSLLQYLKPNVHCLDPFLVDCCWLLGRNACLPIERHPPFCAVDLWLFALVLILRCQHDGFSSCLLLATVGSSTNLQKVLFFDREHRLQLQGKKDAACSSLVSFNKIP